MRKFRSVCLGRTSVRTNETSSEEEYGNEFSGILEDKGVNELIVLGSEGLV